MNPNNEYFPYPFISSFTDDYNDKKFEVTTSSSEDMEKWIFNSTVTLEDDALKKLVAEKKAKYIVSIESKALGYRKVFEFFDDNFSYSVALKDVSRKVFVKFFLVANEDLTLSSKNFHADYMQNIFQREKGDVLGEAVGFDFDPQDDSDEIKDIGSIISVVKDPKKEVGPIWIGLDSKKIIIYLSRTDHQNYSRLVNTGNTSTLISIIVIPALLEAINLVQKQAKDTDDFEYQDNQWYKVLSKKIISLGYSEHPSDWDDTLEIIQKIIDNQISTALKDMLESYGEEDLDD